MSFHPVKHITTGEGGAIFTNNGELNSLFKSLRSHGIHKSPDILNKRGKCIMNLGSFHLTIGLQIFKQL